MHRIATCGRSENDRQGFSRSGAAAQRKKIEAFFFVSSVCAVAPLRENLFSKMTDSKKVAGVIVSHGQLAGELLAAAEMIVGPISHIAAVSIGWHDDVDAARDEVQRAMTRVSQGMGVLLLTDMFGGTPTNIASMFLEEGAVEVLTGVNLPMVIKLATATAEESLAEIAPKIRDQGRQGIYLAGALLEPPTKAGAD
jgi:mannose PTS system EIIA component